MKRRYSGDELAFWCIVTWCIGFCFAMGLIALQVLAWR